MHWIICIKVYFIKYCIRLCAWHSLIIHTLCLPVLSIWLHQFLSSTMFLNKTYIYALHNELILVSGFIYKYQLRYHNWYSLTNYMGQSSSWEASSSLASQEFPAFYGTLRFITAFTTARHPSLFWARSIQPIPSIPLLEDPCQYYSPIYA